MRTKGSGNRAMPSLSQPSARGPRAAGPGARRGHHAARLVLTGAVLAGMVAGCASQPGVSRGSVTSCAQFGIGAIRRHVTVTVLPAACRGLSQVEVNVAVGRALRTVAAGVHGKVRQRQFIARDSPYLAGLVRAVPTSGQPAVASPPSGPPSRAALGLAALAAWLVTVGLGVSMMARWVTRSRRRGAPPGQGQGRRPVLNFTHLGLALTGLLAWISYLATGVTGLAWAACGLLIPVAGLGMALVFRASAPAAAPAAVSATTAATATLRADPPSVRHLPALVVAAHITAASVTILLAVLAAIGSG